MTAAGVFFRVLGTVLVLMGVVLVAVRMVRWNALAGAALGQRDRVGRRRVVALAVEPVGHAVVVSGLVTALWALWA